MRIIAGPCQHESLGHSRMIAEHCKSICDSLDIEYVFKASYDKANRTSIQGQRGIGISQTLKDFVKLKTHIKDLKILTDVHEVGQINYICGSYYDAVDILQIPAFLCRQTDLIKEAVKSNKIVNIKKGQFLAPWDVKGILSKTKGAREIWITERGTSFGYNNLVVDFTGILYMLERYNCPIVFDVTHSVQKPGGKGSSSGGNRNFVAPLSRGAAAMGVDNFFLEVHDDPDNAPSDGPNMIRLDNFETVIKDIKDSYRE
jgi:2-dehydro-3-deoxyphosphooctonate aldolase (KDO 8-P synthase)